jgi:hypothetical protein
MKDKPEQKPVRDGRGTYILNIYHRHKESPKKLVGTIEEVSTGEKLSFRLGEELIDYLSGK